MVNDSKSKHENYFIIPKLTFTVIGIDPLGHNEKIIKHPLVCFFYYILAFIFAVASIDFGLKNVDDINKFTLAVSLLNQLLIALWKIAIFFYKRKNIVKLIQTIWQWNANATKDEWPIIENFCAKNLLISKFYFVTVGFAGASGLLRPIVVKLITYIQGVESELEIPHKATFFWNTSNVLGYIGAFAWNLVVINFVWNASVAIDSLFLWLVTNIFIRFRILKQRFEKAALKNQGKSSRSLIIESIKFHCQTLELAQQLDSIFGEIIFVKSLISCTQICFLAFRFTRKENSIISLYYPFTFLTAVALQLILYCYSGQLIKDQSVLVSTNIFTSFKWSQLPQQSQKMLQMIMLRAQKSSNITGIFFNLDLCLYLWFFKTAGSLIAVLETLSPN